MNPNGSKIRDTIIKMAKVKDKEKTLKTARGGKKKTVILKQILIRPSTNFFAKKLEARLELHNIFEVY